MTQTYIESEALLAMIRDDGDEVTRLLRKMLPGELSELARSCDALAAVARAERDLRS